MLLRLRTTPTEQAMSGGRVGGVRLPAAVVAALQPRGSSLTLEADDRGVTAYADGAVAGHALVDEAGRVEVTVHPCFRGRGIEERLQIAATGRRRQGPQPG